MSLLVLLSCLMFTVRLTCPDVDLDLLRLAISFFFFFFIRFGLDLEKWEDWFFEKS